MRIFRSLRVGSLSINGQVIDILDLEANKYKSFISISIFAF